MNAKRDALFCFGAAAVLLLAALAVVFGLRPGGFETQIGWVYGLVPGELPAQVVADQLGLGEWKVTVSAAGLLLTFGWYFLICTGFLRAWRRLIRVQGPADGWWPEQQ